MTFLHPALLWFGLAALVPILLHLLTLHRLKTVELSTYRFLFDSYVQQRRRTQFLEALLAFLRALFLFLLALAVCRPVVKHWAGLFGGSDGDGEVVLLVDCSASMNATTAGITSLQRAKDAALAVVEKMGGHGQLTLVRVGARPEDVFNRFKADTGAIRERIEGLKVGPSRGDLAAALRHAFDPKAPPRVKPTVYVFTDGQAAGWSEVEEVARQRRGREVDDLVPAGTPIVVVNVGAREPMTNLAVIGEPPPSRVVAGLPVVLTARVVNHSKTEPAEVPVSVFVGKEVARFTLKLQPGETKAQSVVYTPTEPGNLRGFFEIPPDRFKDDNQYRFALSVEPVRVLLVNGNPAADPLDNEALYLRAALSAHRDETPTAPPGGAGADLRGPARSLEVREVPETGLTAETLRDVGVVVLANCGGLTPQQFAWLRGFVQDGGGLLAFPGDRVTNPEVYNAYLFSPADVPTERLTTLRYGPVQGETDKAESFAALQCALDHPVLSVFRDRRAGYFDSVRVYRRFPLVAPPAAPKSPDGPAAPPSWTLAKFSTGGDALVECRLGDGVAVLAGFPANARWTNLPVKPEFVPLVLRLVAHVSRPELEVPSVVGGELAAKVAVKATWAPVSGKVTDPRDRSEDVPLERDGHRLRGFFERTAEPGYYTVDVRSSRPDLPRAGMASFAVNLTPEESNFTPVEEKSLRTWLPRADVRLVDASAEEQQLHGAVGAERETWRPLIVLLFLVIGVEFFLATLRGPRLDEQERTVAQRIRDLNPGNWVGRMTGAAPMN